MNCNFKLEAIVVLWPQFFFRFPFVAFGYSVQPALTARKICFYRKMVKQLDYITFLHLGYLVNNTNFNSIFWKIRNYRKMGKKYWLYIFWIRALANSMCLSAKISFKKMCQSIQFGFENNLFHVNYGRIAIVWNL